MGLVPSLPASGPSKAWLALGLLNEAVVAFSHRDRVDGLWDCVCEQARWLIPFQRMAVLVWDGEGRFCVAQRFHRGTLGGPLIGTYQTEGNPIGGLLLKPEAEWSGGPFPDAHFDAFQAWLFSPPPPMSLLAVPLQYEGQRIGSLLFGVARTIPEDQAMLTGLASTYALHACLRYALIQANDERVRAERGRQESEERLKLALRVTRMGLWEWNQGAEVLVRSDGFDRLFGLTTPVNVALPEVYLQRIHAEDLPGLKAVFYNGKDFDVRFRVTRSDGSVKPLVSKGKVLRNASGAAVQIIGVLQEQADSRGQG